MMLKNTFNHIFKEKKVLLTGDTGFKGSWLAIWLVELGADVYGYSLPPRTENDNYVRVGLLNKIHHLDGDIRDRNKLIEYFNEVQPEFTFHLAAQPLVLNSYDNPYETFSTNVLGTVNFFDAVRSTNSVKVAINITSDKCYKNQEWDWGYRETDPMGGFDPYSASKGCSELVTDSFLNSFFSKGSTCNIASVRAGNVIGGGDWAEQRIVPDFFKFYKSNRTMVLRNPYAVRPWQFVLEPLSGYMLLCQKLFENGEKFSGAWNFGPQSYNQFTVLQLVQKIIDVFGHGEIQYDQSITKPHEAKLLKLDISKAVNKLNWLPVLDFEETVKFTVEGYKIEISEALDLYHNRVEQIRKYVYMAKEKNINWAI